MAITRAKQALLMLGHLATLGRGGRGDAVADLAHHLAASAAAYPEAVAGSRLGGASGAPQAPTTALAPPSPRQLPRLPPPPAPPPAGRPSVPAAMAMEAEVLAARVEELRQFEAACRREEAQKEQKRQRIERDRAAVFAPPMVYTTT